MTTHDPALTRLLADALAATLDEFGHMSWCTGWADMRDCDYEPCRKVRAAVRVAREAGLLPTDKEDDNASR